VELVSALVAGRWACRLIPDWATMAVQTFLPFLPSLRLFVGQFS
jgi:hypothetical protein